MAKFEDDELDDIPVTKSTATATLEAPAQEQAAATTSEEVVAKPAQTQKPAVKTANDELEVEFGDQKLMTKSDGLNRIRAEKNKTVRFALLPFIKPRTATSHFIDTKDKKGTFRCAESVNGEVPLCCAKLDEEGMQHFVALALQYTNASPKDGSYEKGTPIEWEVGYVDLSRSNYRSVSGLAPEDSDVYSIDIAMSKKTSGIGYEFVAKSLNAKWKQNPELAAEVEQAAQKFITDGGKKLSSKLGRKLTPQEWRTVLAGLQATSGAEASLENLDELS